MNSCHLKTDQFILDNCPGDPFFIQKPDNLHIKVGLGFPKYAHQFEFRILLNFFQKPEIMSHTVLFRP